MRARALTLLGVGLACGCTHADRSANGEDAGAVIDVDAESQDAGDSSSIEADAAAGTCPELVLLAPTTYGSEGPPFLALDEGYVYYTVPNLQNKSGGRVERVAKAGGASVALATNIPAPLTLSLHADSVYVGTAIEGVVRVPKTGGAVTPFWSGIGGSPITTDQTHVYFSYATGYETLRKSFDGTDSAVVTNNMGFFSVAVDETHVYWAHNTVGRALKIGGGDQILVTSRPDAWCVAVDSDWIYWTNYTGTLERVPKKGGTPQTLGPAMYYRCLTLDSTHVYFAADGLIPGVGRVPKQGGAVEMLNGGKATDVATDATHAYWTTKEGVWRCRKPAIE